MSAVTPLRSAKPPTNPLQDDLTELRQLYQRQPMPTASERIQRLKALKRLLLENQDALVTALDEDFCGRSADDTKLAELMPSVQGVNYAIRHLRGWMRPKYRFAGLAFLPASAKVIYQPLGVVGVVVPWNYPLLLSVGPLTSALAAGNRVMIKMPEHTPRTSALFAKLIKQYLGDDQVRVINGEADVAIQFTQLPYDHLLFTGSTSVGRQVMRAAAENLTPVTLELGGKSPVIVDDNIAMATAAERICFGKSLNAGQTCVAPDYALVPNSKIDEFIQAYQQAYRRMYPTASERQDYTSIINTRQAERLNDWLEQARQQGATVIPVTDQQNDDPQRFPPVLIRDCQLDSTIMQDEIFGPILPIIGYNTLEEAIQFVNERPRPLSLYYFGYKRRRQQQVLENTHSGGVCINETLFHVAVDDLPFGGIGPSGMGHYHAHEGFLTFSKAKGVFSKGRLNSSKLIYPPYGKWLNKLIYQIFIR